MGFTIFEASVSDYAVTGNDVGTGSLLAALADTGFLIGLKRNRFVILVPAILSYLSMCYSVIEGLKFLMPSHSLSPRRGVEQINKELLWNSEFKQFPDHHSWYSGSNLMPWPKYSFCVFILTKIPILEAFISPFLWYCVDGKLGTTFLWIAVIGGPISFYSSIINSNSSMHGKGYHFLFRVLTLKGTFLWRWNPDAIVFNSSKHYGTPSYWVQKFFRESSGATLLDAKLQTNSSTLVASAITWQNSNLPENKGMLIPA